MLSEEPTMVGATLSLTSDKARETPVLVRLNFDQSVANLDMTRFNITGADIFRDDGRFGGTPCTAFHAGNFAGPYFFGVNPIANPDGTPTNVTITLMEGGGYDTENNVVSSTSPEFVFSWSMRRFEAFLNVTEENFPHNLTVDVEFSLAGQKIPTDEIRGLFTDDFDVRGCQVDSLTPKANSTIFTAHVTLLDDRQDVYLRIDKFKLLDSYSNYNNPSNEIYYNNPGYSAMGLTFGHWNGSEVFVPWGGTFCVTPDDEGNTHDGKRFLNVSDTERERERERVCVCVCLRFPEYFCC